MSTVPKIFQSDHTYIRESLRLASKAIASGDWSLAAAIYQEVGAIGATLETLAEEMLQEGRL
jgi:hypothetical protein